MNELATVDPFRQSTDAASLCREIVIATASKIQGRQFVSVEGWQAIAIAHGCAGSARDVERVEGGVRAIGEVRRMSDGQIIATGEGFVGEDETTWFGGENKYGKVLPKRDDYAIRAMAQTRAISRACRSAFAHVVVMMKAGLSTTPAEEVPAGGFDDGNVVDAQRDGPEPFPQGHYANKTALQTAIRGATTAINNAENAEALEKVWKAAKAKIAPQATSYGPLKAWWDCDDPERLGVKQQYERKALALDEVVSDLPAIKAELNALETLDALAAWKRDNCDRMDALADDERREAETKIDEVESYLTEREPETEKMVATANA